MVNSLKSCRSCQCSQLSVVYDFGELPDAGDFQVDQNSGATAPLRLLSCDKCNLLQIDGFIDRSAFYTNYKYTSSSSPSLVQHFSDLSEYINTFGSNLKILEIGSNDGTLLNMLSGYNHQCLGVDPSDIALQAQSSSKWNLVNDFISLSLAQSIRESYGLFDVIISCNSFAHNDQLFDIASSVAYLLRDDGVFVVEVQDADQLFSKNQFDTIYREHVCYFSKSTLSYLLSSLGLDTVAHVSLPIHSGSIRLTAKKVHYSCYDSSSTLVPGDHIPYDTSMFAPSITLIQSIITDLLAQNKTIAAYGASGRSTNILCLSGFNASSISVVFDNSDAKVGLFIPTTDIPIVAKTYEAINSFDCILITAWNYTDQIISELKGTYSFTGQFIIPLPTPRLIS